MNPTTMDPELQITFPAGADGTNEVTSCKEIEMTERTSLERSETTGYLLLSLGCVRRDLSIVATPQVEETEDVLTDILFVNRGHVVLDCSIDEFESRYVQLMVRPDTLADARALGPIHERHLTSHCVLLFGRDDRERLASLGDVRTPSITDLFGAVVKNRAVQAHGEARSTSPPPVLSRCATAPERRSRRP